MCWNLKDIIGQFCDKSGKMINHNKSSILFSPNTPRRFKALMRIPLGVKSSNYLGKHLSFPMGIDGRNTRAFDAIVEKINTKILSWKLIHLSPSTRPILINSILCSMASHILAIYLLPKKTERRIDSTLLKFWWSSKDDKKPNY